MQIKEFREGALYDFQFYSDVEAIDFVIDLTDSLRRDGIEWTTETVNDRCWAMEFVRPLKHASLGRKFRYEFWGKREVT